jgi:hypothetical protein
MPFTSARAMSIPLNTERLGSVSKRQGSWGSAQTPINAVGISRASAPLRKTPMPNPNRIWGDLKRIVKIPKMAIKSPIPSSARRVQKHFIIMVPMLSQTGKRVYGPIAIKSPIRAKNIPKINLCFTILISY